MQVTGATPGIVKSMVRCARVAFAAVVGLAACTSGSSREVDKIDRSDAEVVIAQGASQEQIAAIRHQISGSPLTKRFSFVSRNAAFRDFHRIFAHSQSITKRVPVTEFPEAFRVELVNKAAGGAFRRPFIARQGVSGVTLGSGPLLDDRHLDISNRFVACHGYKQDLEAYLKPMVTPAMRQAIEAVLSSEPGVRGARLVTSNEAGMVFQCVFRYNIPAEALPESYSIILRPGADVERVVSQLQSLSGIDEVRATSRTPASPVA